MLQFIIDIVHQGERQAAQQAPHRSLRTAAFAIVVLLALIAFKLYTTKAAPASTQLWTPGCVATIPRSWGQYRGGSAQSGLAFEDNAGTLRFLTNVPCGGTPLVALEVRRSGGGGNSSGDGGQ